YNVVIESRDLNAPVLVDECGQKLANRIDRIGDGAAECAAVQVLLGAGRPELKPHSAPQAVGDGRLAGAILRAVADDNDIAFQLLAAGGRSQIIVDAFAA